MERSLDSHNLIASIDAGEISPFLEALNEYTQDAPLVTLKNHLNECIAKLGPESKAEDILNLRTRLAFALAFVKELKARLDDDVFVPWLEKNGDLEVNDIRYYAGYEKKTKLNGSMLAAFVTLFEACGGDEGKFATLLASGAFKPGQCKTVLSEAEWNKLFTVETEASVKEGKPHKKVLEFNERFSKTKNAGALPAIQGEQP